MKTVRKVVLVSMPWGALGPSLQLGILASICHEENVSVATVHASLEMAAIIGSAAALKLGSDRWYCAVSEHLFACNLFGPQKLDSNRFLRKWCHRMAPKTKAASDETIGSYEFFIRLRDKVIPAFLGKTLHRVLEEKPSVVGFTSTFNQVMSSLALAKQIKDACPNIQIVLGGGSFHGEMGLEYHRALPSAVDHVFTGEAEDSFREYLRRWLSGKPTRGIPGVTYRANGEVHWIPGQPLADLNQSPAPDYDGFFREISRLPKKAGADLRWIDFVPFESARGCWWGHKRRCAFCGLHSEAIPFREKDVDRVVSDIVLLSAKHHLLRLRAADLVITRKSRKVLFQKLKDLDLGIELFYEVRCDLSKEEISLMKDAGVVVVQPGIESLSTEFLRLLRKGSDGIHNVQFLRWCREYNVDARWNLLAGLPGDKAEWYLNEQAFFPKISHLQPPKSNARIEMHRYSPLYEARNSPEISEWDVRFDYQNNFPRGLVDPKKIGYCFEYKSPTKTPEKMYARTRRKAFQKWRQDFSHGSICFYTLGPGFVWITDRRPGIADPGNKVRLLYLEGLAKDILLLADKIQSVSNLRKLLQPLYPSEVGRNEVEEAVDEMVEDNLMMRERDFVLTLPIGSKSQTTEQLYSRVLGENWKKESGLVTTSPPCPEAGPLSTEMRPGINH